LKKLDRTQQPSTALDNHRQRSTPFTLPSALSLGSNLGDRENILSAACGKLADLPQTRVIAVSSFYETEPVDSPPGSPMFLNAVVLLDTALEPLELLCETQSIENAFGRVRSVPNAPRTLDIDILFVGDLVLNTPELTLPHPRAHLRRFVLEPLAELLPDFTLPNQTQTVNQLLNKLRTQSKELRIQK